MNRLIGVFGSVMLLLITGCTVATPTPIPSKTPTQSIFIRVPTPSAYRAPTTKPTLVPTEVISGTVIVSTPTENSDVDADPDANPDPGNRD